MTASLSYTRRADAIFRIRATRANPPGLARGERAATYGAALAQFDELMAAGRASGPASRPLPLFYALSQAGRAIAAAHLPEPWRLTGHGLTAPDLDYDVLDVPVQIKSRKSKDGNLPSFAAVANASHQAVLPRGRITLRELWSSLPEVFALLPEPSEAVPLQLVPNTNWAVHKPYDFSRVQAAIVGISGSTKDIVNHLKAHFPWGPDVQVQTRPVAPGVALVDTQLGAGVGVSWPADVETIDGHLDVLQQVAPSTREFKARWMRPAIRGVLLSPLLTWWMLLFGLSMLARYQPDVWVQALEYDASTTAAALDQLLEVACDRVPEVVLDALSDRPTSYVIEP